MKDEMESETVEIGGVELGVEEGSRVTHTRVWFGGNNAWGLGKVFERECKSLCLLGYAFLFLFSWIS